MNVTQERYCNEINGTNVKELSTFNTFTIYIYSDKLQPITKKHFAQEYKFLGPTNEHPPFRLCLRPDNDINEVLSPWMHVNTCDIKCSSSNATLQTCTKTSNIPLKSTGSEEPNA